MRRHLGTIITWLLIITGLVVLLKNSENAREVFGDGLQLFFAFFTTPFILESTVAVIGLIIVITWNKHKLAKETDEWVEMEVPVKPKTEASQEIKTES